MARRPETNQTASKLPPREKHLPSARCGAARSPDFVIACVAERGGPVGRAGLGEDTVDVALDRVRAEIKRSGDLGVSPAPGHQRQDRQGGATLIGKYHLNLGRQSVDGYTEAT
jgi:hypothetical protein